MLFTLLFEKCQKCRAHAYRTQCIVYYDMVDWCNSIIGLQILIGQKSFKQTTWKPYVDLLKKKDLLVTANLLSYCTVEFSQHNKLLK